MPLQILKVALNNNHQIELLRTPNQGPKTKNELPYHFIARSTTDPHYVATCRKSWEWDEIGLVGVGLCVWTGPNTHMC